MTDPRQKWKQFTALSAEKATLSSAIEKSLAAKQEEFPGMGTEAVSQRGWEGKGYTGMLAEGVVCGRKPCTEFS